MGPINRSFSEVDSNAIYQLVDHIVDPYEKTQQNKVLKKLEADTELMGQLITFIQVKLTF
jgi:hypothetical protein